MPTGQVKGTTLHAEFALDLVHQRQRVLHLAVHLVDEGEDGRVARAADLQQPPRLRLHAVGRVDHHQRRVHRGQHAVGVFAEVLVARGVQQVDDAVAVLHLHHRAGHRDAALLLDLHPVAGGVAGGLARLHAAGDLDRAGEQQQLLRQRGLARVGVGNDGKGAAAAHLGGKVGGHGGLRAPRGAWDEVLALRLALRAGLGNLPVSADEADAIVEEARWAFVQHQRLFEQLVAPRSA
jgi:hypothetical protein